MKTIVEAHGLHGTVVLDAKIKHPGKAIKAAAAHAALCHAAFETHALPGEAVTTTVVDAPGALIALAVAITGGITVVFTARIA